MGGTTLTLYRFSERLPDHGQAIFVFDVLPDYESDNDFAVDLTPFWCRYDTGPDGLAELVADEFREAVYPNSLWCSMDDIQRMKDGAR